MTSILTKIEEVQIGLSAASRNTLHWVDEISWNASDPWVPIEIPGEVQATIYQHIRPIRYELTMICLDYTSFYDCFYDTYVQTGKYAIDPTTGERTKIAYFKITAKDHKGVSKNFQVTNARVKTLTVEKINDTESRWIIHFCAEFIQEV